MQKTVKTICIAALFISMSNSIFAQSERTGRLIAQDIAKISGVELLSDKDVSIESILPDKPPLQLKLGFRIEEISFSEARELLLQSGPTIVQKVWKVTITSLETPFPVRSALPIVWINDIPIGVAVENFELTEMTVVVTDPQLLAKGGFLTFSFGSSTKTDRISVASLPKLNITGK